MTEERRMTRGELMRMKALGFMLLGDLFKDTLAYAQIERKLKELEEKK